VGRGERLVNEKALIMLKYLLKIGQKPTKRQVNK